MKLISSLAFVHPEATIGNNVIIDPFAYVDRNVEIGDGTRIMTHATILYGARIGKNCTIFPHATISAIPQDLKFKGEETVAIIGDRTVIRECATVNRGTASKGFTIVGEDCLIMAYSHVAHRFADTIRPEIPCVTYFYTSMFPRTIPRDELRTKLRI
jgi:UDP-N-acetylglucosamine acyltransferase